jgi:hypothetical protein
MMTTHQMRLEDPRITYRTARRISSACESIGAAKIQRKDKDAHRITTYVEFTANAKKLITAELVRIKALDVTTQAPINLGQTEWYRPHPHNIFPKSNNERY